jgi:hypothetical protein
MSGNAGSTKCAKEIDATFLRDGIDVGRRSDEVEC